MKENGRRPFAGFPTPNYTPVPDALFDDLLAELSNSELRVVLYAIRRIYGWRKDEDWITLDQFISGQVNRDGSLRDKGCGLSRQGVVNGLQEAVEHGYLECRVVCGRCSNEVHERETVTRTLGGPGKQKRREVELVPKLCPFCRQPLRDSHTAHRRYYKLRLVNDVDQYQSTRLTGTSQRGRPLPVNDVDPQQTIQTDTDNNSVVAVLLSLGIADRTAREWCSTYGGDRVGAVVDASERATDNRAGWIRRALEGDWTVTAAAGAETEAEPVVLAGLDQQPDFVC